MTTISIVVPESLAKQKRELESNLTTILAEEEKLVTRRKEIQAALAIIASSVAILSGELVPTAVRKPMSEDAKQRISDGLRKAREAKAKATEVVGSASQAPAQATADAPVADTAREAPKRRRRNSGAALGKSLRHNWGSRSVCGSPRRGLEQLHLPAREWRLGRVG
jgi:hypothetical protein